MKFTDTHTHLFSDAFDQDRNEVIQRAMDAGVHKFYLPNIDAGTIDAMHDLEQAFPKNCFAMMGLHPSSVGEDYKEQLAIIESWLEKRDYAGIGETGIDLYWDKTHIEAQKESFEQHVKWAKEKNRPLIIHCREAFDEIFEILDRMNDDSLFGIFHCFTGNSEQAQHIIDYEGFKLGIGGVATFKNGGLDKTLEGVSLQHLVLETDSPYLAPTPFRGKRNESAYLINVAEKLCSIYNVSLAEVSKITEHNTKEIFK